MMVHGRVTLSWIAWANCSAAFWLRYSLRNFTELLFQAAEFFEVLEDTVRFLFVDDADGEAHVDENVFTDFGFRRVGEVNIFADASEVDLGLAEGDVAVVDDFNYTAWNGEAHKKAPKTGFNVSMFQCFNVSRFQKHLSRLDLARYRRRSAGPGGACTH